MKLALIADTFPPLQTSGALQLRDLSREFARQGHELTVMIPDANLSSAFKIEYTYNIRILRLHSPVTKDVGYIRRTLNELIMPFAMLRNLRLSPIAGELWEGVIWYSPSIFLGPLVSNLKKQSGCPAYLIIRDIFPEWAVDVGLMGRGFSYRFFKAIAEYQYSVANVIGVQTKGNLDFFADWVHKPGRHLEILRNWLFPAEDKGCSISLSNTTLAGRRILVYAGNMGVAQGMEILLDLATELLVYRSLGFVFVGRGSIAQCLREEAKTRGLDNVLFYDEIDSEEIPGLYAQCHIGLVALDRRHKTHNIPGKFISYMQQGLPVLAIVNPGNDVENLIRSNEVGEVCSDYKVASIKSAALRLLNLLENDMTLKTRCRDLGARLFSPKDTIQQIVMALVTAGRQ